MKNIKYSSSIFCHRFHRLNRFIKKQFAKISVICGKIDYIADEKLLIYIITSTHCPFYLFIIHFVFYVIHFIGRL